MLSSALWDEQAETTTNNEQQADHDEWMKRSVCEAMGENWKQKPEIGV